MQATTNNHQLHSRSLSTVIGLYFLIFFLTCSLAGLLWTYITANQLIGQQLSNTFKQRLAIAENILSHQEKLILYSLRAIKSNKALSEKISQGDPAATRKVLIYLLDSIDDFPLDILYFARHDNNVIADASSPFFKAAPILPLIAEKQLSLLAKGALIRLNNNGTDLTVLVRAITLTREETGKVLGTLFGGVVINDNMSLFEQIRRETDSKAVLFLADGAFVGATERKESATTQTMWDSARLPTKEILFGSTGISHTPTGLILSARKITFQGAATNVTIVFAITDKILSDLRNSYLQKGIALILGAFIFLLLSIVVVRRFTFAPLHCLLKYSDDISGGKMESNYHPGKIKEFNQLGKAMENMVTSLQDTHQQLLTDIAARQQAEKARRESEVHFRTLIETIPDLIWLKDPQGIYLACNPRFEQFLGATQEEIVGKTDYDFFDKELADFFRKHDAAAIANSKPSINEEVITFASDGHQEEIETIKTPMLASDGSLVGVLGIARNITDRKKAEEEKINLESRLQQAQKMEAIGTLAGGIAHDFNNILGAILGYAEIAREDSQEGSTIGKCLNKVLQAGLRAKELVKQILAFSRLAENQCIPLQPASIVKEAIKMLRPTLPTTIEIKQNISAKTGLVLADPTQLNQILMNLCTNAFHAMEKTGGKLDISLKEINLGPEDLTHEPNIAPGNFIHLSIQDSGPGIPAAIRDKIFDPYFTTKETGKGTGMGLSIVHGIVKSYGGFISLHSEPDQETAFNVFLPVLAKEVRQQIEIADQAPRGNERILFIDDEEILVEIGKEILGRLGYQVTGSTDSLKALNTFLKQPDQFDLVITDQTMPGMTGAELATKMMQVRPDLPIILCTGYSTIISEEQAKAMGIKEFVLKPLAKEDIAILIRKVLDSK